LLIVLENFRHAMFIAAFIVHENKTCLAFSADVSKYVIAAAMNVNVALTFEEVIVRNTFET
jgi:hypothetical protein